MGAFDYLTHLVKLRLGRNELTEIKKNLFLFLTDLESL